MNYIKELNAFRDWVILNRLSTGQIALWHSLMMLCNKFGWPKQFTVSNQMLQLTTGLSRQGLEKARNQLQQKGRIRYEKGHSNQAGTYRLIYFFSFSTECQKVGTEIVTEGGTGRAQKEAQEGRESSTLNKNKLKTETEINDTNVSLRTPDQPVSESPVKRLLDYWVSVFGFTFQEQPVINWEKEGKIIKDLLGTFGEEKLKGLIDAFFTSKDKFITGSTYSVGVFKTQINKLLAEQKNSPAKLQDKYKMLYSS